MIMERKLLLVLWFKRFIRDTEKGIRNKNDGGRIKKNSTNNYYMLLKNLLDYEKFYSVQIKMRSSAYLKPSMAIKENQYWDHIYRSLCDYFYDVKGFHDNYVGSMFKTLKSFLFYMKDHKRLIPGGSWERFYIRKDNIRIISLLPDQLSFLILDSAFDQSLKPSLKKTKDMFVFGCTAALRFSDLVNLKVKDVEVHNGRHFLYFRSIKTDIPTRVILPFYALTIYRKYAGNKSPDEKLFPNTLLFLFNNRLRKLGCLAGWKDVVGKFRSRNGCTEEIKNKNGNTYLFYELLSSHVMRRTGITVLLMMGMPEYLVRKISGHSAGSKEFFRYVNYADSFITAEISRAQLNMLSTYQ